MMSKECKLIGGIGCLLLAICLISTATAITEYETKAITPTFNNETYFSIYNDDSQTYQIYIYNHTGTDTFFDGIIGRIEPHQSIYLPKNASYYLYCEYPDEIRLESLDDVKQGVNRYWVIVVVLIIIIVALYTAIRIIRGKRY